MLLYFYRILSVYPISKAHVRCIISEQSKLNHIYGIDWKIQAISLKCSPDPEKREVNVSTRIWFYVQGDWYGSMWI